MQTIIMTVGTSLRNNADRDLLVDKQRPWVKHSDKYNSKVKIIRKTEVLAWMGKNDMEVIIARNYFT